MDYRLMVKNLQHSIDAYFREGRLNYNNGIVVLEEIYRLSTMNHDPSFIRRIEDIIVQ